MNKKVGDKVVADIPCAEAYGEYDEEGVQQIPRAQLPEGVEVGARLAAQTESGHVIPVLVKELTDTEATLDFNHELAGQDLTFEIEVISVREATPEELAHGHAHGADGHADH
jgi:FKBP-type peptidyl-prolyl cis-trans isomerase SlyD